MLHLHEIVHHGGVGVNEQTIPSKHPYVLKACEGHMPPSDSCTLYSCGQIG